MRVPIAYLDHGAVPLPKIRDVQDAPEVIEHVERTAGGHLRADIVAAKRQWVLFLHFLREAEWRPIIEHLANLGWGETTFWIDDMSGDPASDSIPVIVRVESSERVRFNDRHGWERNGRHLGLLVREV